MTKRKPKLKLGILQRNITYVDGFWRWGCFVACILTAIQRSLGRKLFAVEIQQWYWRCVVQGFFKHNDVPIRKGTDWWRCFVVDYIGAFNLGMQMFGGARRARHIDTIHQTNVRIYRWKTLFGWHFTYGSQTDNLHDPDPKLKLLLRVGQRDMYIQEVEEAKDKQRD